MQPQRRSSGQESEASRDAITGGRRERCDLYSAHLKLLVKLTHKLPPRHHIRGTRLAQTVFQRPWRADTQAVQGPLQRLSDGANVKYDHASPEMLRTSSR